MSGQSQSQGWGLSHLSQYPVTVWFAVIVVMAVVGLWLIRHFRFSASASTSV